MSKKPGFMSASGGQGGSRPNKGRISAGQRKSELPGVEQEERPEMTGGLLRGRLVNRFIRNRVAALLVNDHDFDPESAKDAVEGVTDAEINSEAMRVGVSTGIADGGFLQWLKDHQDQIFQLIMAIAQILAMFGVKNVKKGVTHRKKDHKEDEQSSATEQ